MISSSPTPEELTSYQKYLTDAEKAYNQLMTGVAAVSISYNGEAVSYTSASKKQLLAYIRQLRKALKLPDVAKSVIGNPAVAFVPVVFGRRR